MRVLHVIPSIAPCYGGPSRAVVEMSTALRRQGVDTLLATTDADGAARLDVSIGKIDSFKDLPTIFFPRQFSEALKYSGPLAKWLARHVSDFDAVHIHAVFSHACVEAAKACRQNRVPYVVRPLGTLDPWSLKQKRLKKMLFWHLGVKQMLSGASAIHYTTTAEMKAAEESLGMTRGIVIPLGIENDLFDEVDGLSVDTNPEFPVPYVLVLSRLHRKKGLETLVPAFLSLVKKRNFSNWQLVLAGAGESKYVSSLKKLVKSHGGNGNVVFAGWLEGTRRKNTLRQASLLALTSYQENFGLCAVEALACGVPVLLSPHVNLAHEVEEAGAGWVTRLETAALEQTLAQSLGDQKERVKRGIAGKRFVREHFGWDVVAKELLDLYGSITSSAP